MPCSSAMLPQILHPEQLKGYRFSSNDQCRIALLSHREPGDCTIFIEIHEPKNRVPAHSHHQAAELFFILRGSVVFHVDGQTIQAHQGDFVTVPGAAIHDLENPGCGRVYMLTVLSRDEGFSERLAESIPTPLDAEDIETLHSL